MLSHHIDDLLDAYCHGELPASEARRAAEHLMQCERCRAGYDEVRAGVTHLERLELATAPDDIWDGIVSALEQQHGASEAGIALGSRSIAHHRTWAATAAIAASIAIIAVASIAWYALRTQEPTWAVRSLTGAPIVGASHIGERGALSVGQSLETDDRSSAEIRVGAIGTVEVEPNSKVRMLDADLSEHRMALDRGTLHARIWAPPRLFFVDTPSGEAIDYGCAYTLAVDDAGETTLHVTLGWVALARDGAESLVPAGAECSMRKGAGPGTPVFADASAGLRSALAAFDFDGAGEGALATVLAEARARDSLTLWHLLARVPDVDRERVYDRLAALAPPPEGVSREQALGLDHKALETWRRSLRSTW